MVPLAVVAGTQRIHNCFLSFFTANPLTCGAGWYFPSPCCLCRDVVVLTSRCLSRSSSRYVGLSQRVSVRSTSSGLVFGVVVPRYAPAPQHHVYTPVSSRGTGARGGGVSITESRLDPADRRPRRVAAGGRLARPAAARPGRSAA